MQTRKITVYQTKNQSKKTIMSAATTLAELKADLRANNIDYDGMSFFEGTSKVELKNDESVLPHDVPYKGTITNELVFMLTNTNKKIRSGAMTRMEAYAAIKANNLQDVVKEKLRKNYTMCKTDALILIVENNTKNNTKKVEDTNSAQDVENLEPVAITLKTPANEVVDKQARQAISMIANALWDNEVISDDLHEEILQTIGVVPAGNNKPKSSYSDDEIENMFEEWAN